jgi:hydrogenase large subunit
MRYVEFMKKVVPDARRPFDFFYEALPATRRSATVAPARLLGLVPGSRALQLRLQGHDQLGPEDVRHPGVVVDGKLSPPTWSRSTSASGSCSGSSYYDDWEDQETFVSHDPLGNPVGPAHPWNQHTTPSRRSVTFDDKYSWVCRRAWYDGKDYLALDTAAARWPACGSTALAGLVDIGYVKATGSSVQINLPKTRSRARSSWSGRSRSGATPSSATAPAPTSRRTRRPARCTSREGAGGDPAGRTKTWETFEVPDEGIGCGFTEAVRGVLSHHMVIRDGKIANYHPYPPTPWNATRGTATAPRPVRGRRPGPADLRGERPGALQGHRHHAHRCAASTRACRAACTCTSAAARSCELCTRPPSPVTGE